MAKGLRLALLSVAAVALPLLFPLPGHLYSMGSWTFVALFLIAVAIFVHFTVETFVPHRSGLSLRVLLCALAFMVTWAVFATVIFSPLLLGITEQSSGQEPPWDDALVAMLVAAAVLGPAFGALVGMLSWACRLPFAAPSRSSRLPR